MATGPSAQDRTEAHIPPVNDTTTQQRLRDEAIPAVEPTTAPVQHSSAVPPRIDTSTRTSTEPEGRSGSPADSDARLTQTGTSHRPETATSQPVSDEQTLQSPRKSLKNARFDWGALKEYIDPSSHDLLPEGARIPPREYNARLQKYRLWRLTWGEFLITLLLCGAYAGCLGGYALQVTGLSTVERRVFNAITTGISAALGVNFSASLRSYAKMLRWRMLASKYRNLSQFELILDADRNISVFKLFLSDFRRKKRRFLLITGTQLLCMIWLTVNLAAIVLVGIIGLTYNLENSQTYISLINGPVSVFDFSYWIPAKYQSTFDQGTLEGFQNLAYQTFWQLYPIADLSFDSANTFQDQYQQVSQYPGYAQYYFTDFNVEDSSESVETQRYIYDQAYCQSYQVVKGQFGNSGIITYIDDNGKHANIRIFDQEQPPGPGGLAISSSTNNQTCGPRCVQMTVFQAQADNTAFCSNLEHPHFFICNNTIAQVQNLPSKNAQAYEMDDFQALYYAGAMGWSGTVTDGTPRQFQTYLNCDLLVQYWAQTALTEDLAANLISGYAMATLAVMDDAHSTSRKTIQGQEPVYAQVLVPVWWHAGPLLIVIPAIHFLSLVTVIWFSSRVVIKDDGYLATAKLYAPIIAKLEDHGCISRGDQIIESLGDPKVVYGWRQVGGHDGGGEEDGSLTTNGSATHHDANGVRDEDHADHEKLYHVDCFEEGSEGVHTGKKFAEGRYDGSGVYRRYTGYVRKRRGSL